MVSYQFLVRSSCAGHQEPVQHQRTPDHLLYSYFGVVVVVGGGWE